MSDTSMAGTQDAKASAFNATRKALCIFGYPIARSKSPIIHNTGYKLLQLPHHFSIREMEHMERSKVEPILRAPDFGGAAVTMPFKQSIMQLVDELSGPAKLLGAVNTVIRVDDVGSGRRLLGDNTDWIGIQGTLTKGIRPEMGIGKDATGLVIGGGGAARAAVYALGQMGVNHVYIFNRSKERLLAIVEDFKNYPVTLEIIASLSLEVFTKGPPAFVVGTVPAKGTSTASCPAFASGALQLNSAAFSRTAGGCMLDMAYLPQRTPLVQLAEQAPAFAVSHGIDVLLEQAFAQFELWTGLPAPREEMAAATMTEYNREMALA